jgi:hypothetical protein
VDGRELSDELGSNNRAEKDPEFRASSIEGRRKVLAMISFWDAVDSHQLIIEGLPRAEKIMISDRTEKDMAFPSEWFDMLSIIR